MCKVVKSQKFLFIYLEILKVYMTKYHKVTQKLNVFNFNLYYYLRRNYTVLMVDHVTCPPFH